MKDEYWYLWTLSVFISWAAIPPAGPRPGLDAAEQRGSYNQRGQLPALSSMGALLMDGEGWDDALHTPLDTHPPNCTIQTILPKINPVWRRENRCENNLRGVTPQVFPNNQVRTRFPCLPQVRALCCAEKGLPHSPSPCPQGGEGGGVTASPSAQCLSPRLRWARDHRRAAGSAQEASDGVGARVIQLFLEKFFHSEIIHTADHRNTCKHEISFLRIPFPGLPRKVAVNGKSYNHDKTITEGFFAKHET